MDGLAIIVMLLALLGLIGVLVYVLRDYSVHKESNVTAATVTTTTFLLNRE